MLPNLWLAPLRLPRSWPSDPMSRPTLEGPTPDRPPGGAEPEDRQAAVVARRALVLAAITTVLISFTLVLGNVESGLPNTWTLSRLLHVGFAESFVAPLRLPAASLLLVAVLAGIWPALERQGRPDGSGGSSGRRLLRRGFGVVGVLLGGLQRSSAFSPRRNRGT